MNERRIAVFADGSCFGIGRPGGFAAIIIGDHDPQILRGGNARTSRNREGLRAIIAALESLESSIPLAITSENQFLLSAVHSKWVHMWAAKGWTAINGEPIRDDDLWQMLYNLTKGRDIIWDRTPEHDVVLEKNAVEIAWEEERKAEAAYLLEQAVSTAMQKDSDPTKKAAMDGLSDAASHSLLRGLMQRHRQFG